ncbi:DUF4302 domain-containing protein [Prevotella sp. A2931]|uniref:DUF4302 domain-containing protein n=1 Tax=Prevotella illustrans TaxID=2800387 RepID=A0ABS3M217_9BACT|nr:MULTISPECIES: DUF4302 domain-containing protein [Prevotella]MBO1362208.1 DUF4302 domain-containing protein [Prevotella illustrans]PTL26519.1 hypothetical protein C3V39_05330 [Prevotella sp. oral taxon 820]
MNKLYSLLFMVGALAMASSCTPEIKDVFDKPAATRIMESIENTKQVLVSAPNGWRVAYQGSSLYGGYNLICQFDKDNGVHCLDVTTQTEDTSHYSVEQSQGVLLSFDSFNKAFHIYSDPVANVGTNGKGYEGDFEFRVLKATADSVIMAGKKHNARIVMTPMAANQKWADFVSQVNTVKQNMKTDRYKLIVGDVTYPCTMSYNVLKATDAEGTVHDIPVIYTPAGLDVLTPVTLNGKVISGFTYTEDDNWLDKVDKTIKLVPASTAELFINGWWTPNMKKSSAKVVQLFQAAAKANTKFPLSYAYFGTESISLGSQFGISIKMSKYWGQIVLGVEQVDDETIVISGKTTADANGDYFTKNFHWDKIIEMLTPNGKPGTYKLKANKTKLPTRITLTCVEDPSIVFVCDKGDVKISF